MATVQKKQKLENYISTRINTKTQSKKLIKKLICSAVSFVRSVFVLFLLFFQKFSCASIDYVFRTNTSLRKMSEI